MAGYIIELHKHDQNDLTRKLDKKVEQKPYITYGDFDKMTISTVTTFSRYRDMSEFSRNWKGDRQTLLVFELSQDNEIIYRSQGSNEGFFTLYTDKCKYEICDKLFIGITVLQFRKNPKDVSQAIKDYLKKYREKILAIVNEHQGTIKVNCSVFGILGSFGVAILWASDQFTEILKLINIIKPNSDSLEEEYPLLSAFTIFAKNPMGEYKLEKHLHDLQGDALLHLTLKNSYDDALIQKLKENICNIESYHSAGEFDLILITKAQNLLTQFEKNKILDPDNPFYKKHILQTNVRLCEKIVDVDCANIDDSIEVADSTTKHAKKKSDVNCEFEKNNEKICQLNDKVKTKYEELRKFFYEVFPKTAGMVDSLDLLYADYHAKIAAASNKMWATDFSEQFLAILDVVYRNLQIIIEGNSRIPAINMFDEFKEILNSFEHQIVHIAESNNLILDTPKCHLTYTGQSNLTLYAYFGVIKDILEIAYSMQGMCKQSKIIPLLSTDIVPMINSDLYTDYGNSNEDRVLITYLPVISLYNIPIYIPYLYHEIFHYIVPEDRVVRNWIKGRCLTTIAVRNVISNTLCNRINDESVNQTTSNRQVLYSSIEAMVNDVFMPFIYKAVTKHYDDHVFKSLQSCTDQILKKGDVNKQVKSWINYEELLIDNLRKMVFEVRESLLQNNLFYQVFNFLCGCEANITGLLNKWFQKTNFVMEINNAVEELFVRIKAMTSVSNNEQKANILFNIFGEVFDPDRLINTSLIVGTSMSLSEAVCDSAMVELSGMDCVAYLLTYIKIQKDLLKNSRCKNQIQDVLRVGLIIDNFLGFGKTSDNQLSLDAIENDFICSYIGMFYSEKNATKMKNYKRYLSGLENEASEWFHKLTGSYKIYLKEYRIFSGDFQKILNQSCIQKRLKKNTTAKELKKPHIKKYYEVLKQYGRLLRSCLEDDKVSGSRGRYIAKLKNYFDNQVFDINIDIILHYQQQKSFEEINDIRDDVYKDDDEYELKYEDENTEVTYGDTCFNYDTENAVEQYYDYKVKDIEGLASQLRSISEQLRCNPFINSNSGLWFRGQQKKSYVLLPSAMRRYSSDKANKRNLREYQRAAYEEFKFRMDGASEKIDKVGYTACDYLTLMQHYSAPTIYLDWSENALHALYFALESYIDPKKKTEQNNEDAVLYILSPTAYNAARDRMMLEYRSAELGSLTELMKETIQHNERSIPNISVEYNQKKYAMFLLGEIEDKSAIENMIADLSWTDPKQHMYLPLAVYASRTNARIQAQYGTFVAFNIFTPMSQNDDFDYMNLEKVQNHYLSMFNDASPFLYSIVIEAGSKPKIAEWLKTVGLSKEMIYPELSNIGERIL